MHAARTAATSGVLALGIAAAGVTAPAARAQRAEARVEPRVEARAGRIVYTPAAGPARVLTTTGRDTTPALSPDGTLVAFTRGTPGDSVDTGLGAVERTELWTVRTDGTGASRLLRGGDGSGSATTPPDDAHAMERVLAGLYEPVFSPDGRTLYVLGSAWVTSSALHAVDVATGRERFLCDANGIEVLQRGPYRGYLLRWWHHYRPDAAHDEVWLVTPACKSVRMLGGEGDRGTESRMRAAREGRLR